MVNLEGSRHCSVLSVFTLMSVEVINYISQKKLVDRWCIAGVDGAVLYLENNFLGFCFPSS